MRNWPIGYDIFTKKPCRAKKRKGLSDLQSQTTDPKDGGRYLVLLTTVGAPAMALMYLLDTLLLLLSPQRRFLYEPFHWVGFCVQGLCLAVLLAIWWSGWLWGVIWGGNRLYRFRFLHWRGLGILVQVFFSFLLGTLLMSNGWGGTLGMAPMGHYLLVFGISLAVGAWGYVTSQRVSCFAFNGLTLLAALFGVWVVGHYLPRLFASDFGLHNSKTGLRTLVAIGVPLVTFLFVPLIAWIWTWQPMDGGGEKGFTQKVTSWAVIVFLVLGVAVGIWMDRTYYVDNYLELHSWLRLLAIVMAFLAARLFGRVTGFSKKRPEIRRWWVLGAMTVGLYLWSMGLETVFGYVGAIHTSFQRHGLELIREDILMWHRLPLEAHGYVVNRWNRFRNRALPAKKGPLPRGFHSMKPTPQVKRPTLKGAVLLFLDRKRPKDLGIYRFEDRKPSGSIKQKAGTKTPHIDKLFRDGFVFSACHSAGSSTEVAFPTIYTSTYAASRHQRRHTATQRPVWFSLGRGRNLLTTFSKAGFRTTVVTNRWYAEVFFNHPLKKDIFGAFQHLLVGRESGGNGVSALRTLLEAHPEVFPKKGKFLTVFHILPQSLDSLKDVDALVGRIQRLLVQKGRIQDTLVLLTADHGVQFREHGRTHYGFTLFDEEIRVPLLIRIPGLRGSTIRHAVSSVDHLPTLVDLFSLDMSYEVEGWSYLPELLGKISNKNRVLFSETRKPFHSVAAIQGPMKLIYWFSSGAKALFHRGKDPSEAVNLISNSSVAKDKERLWKALATFLEERGESTWP